MVLAAVHLSKLPHCAIVAVASTCTGFQARRAVLLWCTAKLCITSSHQILLLQPAYAHSLKLLIACVQQQQLAEEVVQHLPMCLAAPSIAVQLAGCQLMHIYSRSPHARGALRGGDIVKRLVELNTQRHPLTAAPAVSCVGLLCELDADNADAVIRANGMHSMLCTLEEDCPAQVCVAFCGERRAAGCTGLMLRQQV